MVQDLTTRPPPPPTEAADRPIEDRTHAHDSLRRYPLSARSAGRIAAITTGKSLGVPVRAAAPAPSSDAEVSSAGGPLIPQVEPGAVIGAGERAGLASLVS